jgi:AraC-like DNA-binding protein
MSVHPATPGMGEKGDEAPPAEVKVTSLRNDECVEGATMSGSRYEERPPHPALAHHLVCTWTQYVPADSGGHVQRVVPDGCVDVIWRDGALEVAGPDTAPRLVALAPGSSLLGIRFRPGAAPLLLGDVPASALRDTGAGLDELWGVQAHRLAERLHAVGDPRVAADLLEWTVATRLPDFRPDRVIEAVVAALDRPDPVSVTDLAASLGLSERQLRRRVIAAVGYGPKTLERVLRFQRTLAIGQAQAGRRRRRLAEVAAAVGYADQAHLNREMRQLAGVTPGVLLKHF